LRDDDVARLDAFAAAQDSSRSTAARRLIREALSDKAADNGGR
jgi:hypothetical protein